MAHTVLTQSFYAIPSDVTLNFWYQPNAEMLCRLLMNICLTTISNLQFLAILALNHIHSLHLWPSATFNYLNCHVCYFFYCLGKLMALCVPRDQILVCNA